MNEEPDFHFAWTLNSPARAGQVGGTNGQPLKAGLQDPTFGYYYIQILDPKTGAMVHDDKEAAPGYVFTESMNSLAFGGSPCAAIIFRVQVIDSAGNPSAWATLPVSNPPPPKPSYLNGDGFYGGVIWQWGFTAAPDLAGGKLRVNAVNDFAGATEYDVGNATSKTVAAAAAGAVYAWVCEYDTFGSDSVWLGPAVVVAGSVPAQDVVGLDIRDSQQYPNAVILEGVVWGNNSPAAGSISWTCPASAPCVTWQGKQYVIASGSTALQFVWWKAGENAFRTSDTNPETDPAVTWDQETCFQIALNYQHAGVVQKVWEYTPNLVTGSVYGLAAAFQKGIFGQLIANQLNVIGTLQLQDQSVTFGTSGTAPDAQYADWTSVATWQPPSTGAPAVMLAMWTNSWASNVFAATQAYWRIMRTNDNVQVGGTPYSSLPGGFLHTVFARDPATIKGGGTYALQLKRVGSDGVSPANTMALAPTFLYLETKK